MGQYWRRLGTRILLTVAVLGLVGSTLPAAAAKPEPLDSRALENIAEVVKFLRELGYDDEADNIELWVQLGKIQLDEDLEEGVAGETDGNGDIVLRKADVTALNLTRHDHFVNFVALASLACLIIHEKVHAHQPAMNWINGARSWLSSQHNPWEIEAYLREIDLRLEWAKWLWGDYLQELEEYARWVNDFNDLAADVAGGAPPNKTAMLELLDKIAPENDHMLKKLDRIRELILDAMERASTMKKSNYEKGNYVRDQMQDWENFTQTLDNESRILQRDKENITAWQEWLAEDPPPVPRLLQTPLGGYFPDTGPMRVAWEAAVALRQAYQAEPIQTTAEPLRPFLDRVAALFPDGSTINLFVYTDVNHRVPYFRENQAASFVVDDGKETNLIAQSVADPEYTIFTSQSAILKVMVADDPDQAFEDEIADGRVATGGNATLLLAELARLAREERERAATATDTPDVGPVLVLVGLGLLVLLRRRP